MLNIFKILPVYDGNELILRKFKGMNIVQLHSGPHKASRNGACISMLVLKRTGRAGIAAKLTQCAEGNIKADRMRDFLLPWTTCLNVSH